MGAKEWLKERFGVKELEKSRQWRRSVPVYSIGTVRLLEYSIPILPAGTLTLLKFSVLVCCTESSPNCASEVCRFYGPTNRPPCSTDTPIAWINPFCTYNWNFRVMVINEEREGESCQVCRLALHHYLAHSFLQTYDGDHSYTRGGKFLARKVSTI